MIFSCKACAVKDTVIEELRTRAKTPDDLRDKWITDLQRQIVHLQGELDKKNRELRRAIDMVLSKSGSAPVSEDAYQKMPAQNITPEMFSSMFDEVKEEKHGAA